MRRPKKTTGGSKPLKTAAKIEPDPPAAVPAVPRLPPLPRRGAESPRPVAAGGLDIPGLDDLTPTYSTRGRSSPKSRPKKKSTAAANRGLWIGVGIGGGGLIVALAIILLVVLWPAPTQVAKEQPKTQPSKTEQSKTGQLTKYSSTEEAPKPSEASSTTLVLDWMESERANATVSVDGKPVEVPKSGAVKLSLPVQSTPHRIRLERKGFEPLEFNRMSVADQPQNDYVVAWTALPRGYSDWLQDFDGAKFLASFTNRSILILFDKSDSSEDSKHSAHDIFGDREFRNSLDKDYLLVYIDFPESAEAKENVKDPERNRRLADQFHLKEKDYPTVLLTDKDGQPIGILEGFQKDEGGGGEADNNEGGGDEEGPGESFISESGVNAFRAMLKQWHKTGREYHKATANIKTLSGEEQQKAIGKLLDLLEINDLDRFYKPQIDAWLAMLPPKLQKRPAAVTLGDCRHWVMRFVHCLKKEDKKERKEAVAKVVGEFDAWKKTGTFTDPKMGVQLLWGVIGILAKTEQYQQAAKECEDALALNPSHEYRQTIQYVQQYLLDKANGFINMGTGFCVARGGYIMTAREVIGHAKRIMVRLPNYDKPVQAKLIPSDLHGGMALLQADIPEGVILRPAILASDVMAGENVCALGFSDRSSPGGKRDQASLRITRGIVSTMPNPGDKDPEIETDCRIEPGNIGGPLCNVHGAVVGMVYKKSSSGRRNVDSFGFVLPTATLQAFLKKNLPSPATPSKKKAAHESLGWEEVKDRLERSIGPRAMLRIAALAHRLLPQSLSKYAHRTIRPWSPIPMSCT